MESEKAALESTSQLPFNFGKTYNEVQPRQKQRKVRTIKTAAEQALCFIKSFGLSVEKVVLKSKDDSVVELNYSSPSSPTDTAIDPEQDTSVSKVPLSFLFLKLYQFPHSVRWRLVPVLPFTVRKTLIVVKAH